MNGKATEEAGSSAGPGAAPAPLEWNFSQVFGERTAGEEVQEGMDSNTGQIHSTTLVFGFRCLGSGALGFHGCGLVLRIGFVLMLVVKGKKK